MHAAHIYNTDALVCFLWFVLEGYSDVALIPTSQPRYQSCHQIDKKRGGRMTMRQWITRKTMVGWIQSCLLIHTQLTQRKEQIHSMDQGSMSQRTSEGNIKSSELKNVCCTLWNTFSKDTFRQLPLQHRTSHKKTGWSTSEKTNTAIFTHVPFSLPQIFLQALSVTFSGGAHLPGLGKNALQIPQEGFSMALPPALQLLLFLFLSFLAFFFRGD